MEIDWIESDEMRWYAILKAMDKWKDGCN